MAVRHLKRYASWVQTVEEVIAKTFQVFVIVFSKSEPEELRLNLTKRHQSRRCVAVMQHDKSTNIGKIQIYLDNSEGTLCKQRPVETIRWHTF